MKYCLMLALLSMTTAVYSFEHFSPYYIYGSGNDLYKDMIGWLRDMGGTNTEPETVVMDMMYIVLSRLIGHIPCPQFVITDRLHLKSQWIINTYNDSNHLANFFHDVLHNETHFFKFCNQLLHSALHYSPCCMPASVCIRTQNGLHPDSASLKLTLTFVKQMYNRNAHVHYRNESQSVKYQTDAYANRLLCVRERDVQKSLRSSHLYDPSSPLYPSVIVFFILRGLNFIQQNDPCPIDFLNEIFNGMHDKGGAISTLDFSRILLDLHKKTSSGFSKSFLQHGNHRRLVSHPAAPPSVNVFHSFTRNNNNDNDRQPHHSAGLNPPVEDWNQNYFNSGSGNHHSGGQSGSERSEFHHEHVEFRFLNNYHDVMLNHYQSSSGRHVGCYNPFKLSGLYVGHMFFYGTPTISLSDFNDMCPALLYHILTDTTHCWDMFPDGSTYVNPITQTTPTSPFGKTTTTPRAVPSTDPSSKATASQHTTPDSDALVSTLKTTLLNPNDTVESTETLPTFKGYLYGSISTLIISLCSMLGAAFMKLSQINVRAYMMASMLSLAVGCLVADAALHLLPEVIRSEDVEEEGSFPDSLKKMLALLASVYAFFVLELFLTTKNKHSHGGDAEIDIDQDIQLNYTRPQSSQPGPKLGKYTMKINNQLKEIDPSDLQSSSNGQLKKINNADNETNIDQEHVYDVLRHDDAMTVGQRPSNASDRISVHDMPSDIKALAWMIIIGDGIHNFADGLAIGAAFALTFTKGLSISITVLCHEVPHELGDFAVLVSTGMSIKKAILLNFLSSLTAFAGLYVGLALGAQDEASKWIFSIGAGMFLYVALTDLIPECKEHYKRKPTWKMFIAENIGLLFGYGVMLLLALYEEKLEINV